MVAVTVDREQVRRDAELALDRLSTMRRTPTTEFDVRALPEHILALLAELEQAERQERLAWEKYDAEVERRAQAKRERDAYRETLDNVNVERQRQEVRAIEAERERAEARSEEQAVRRILAEPTLNARTMRRNRDLEAQLAAVPALVEALRQDDVDARWIVGQKQRVPDKSINEVAKAIVERSSAALAAYEQAQEQRCDGSRNCPATVHIHGCFREQAQGETT